MRITDSYVFFYSEFDWPSNFYRAEFSVKDRMFFCMEQYIMFSKAMLFGDRHIAQLIMGVPKWRRNAQMECKNLGRQVQPFSEAIWALKRDGIVCAGLVRKYNDNPKLLTKFLETGNRMMVEASKSDTLWGVGLSEDDPAIDDPVNWRGENLQGKYHMLTRDILRESQPKALDNWRL